MTRAPRPPAAPLLVRGIDALGPSAGRLLVVVGAFDGLHRGHAYLLRRLREAAVRLEARPAVLTFDHHPDEIVRGAAPPVLCDPDERLVRLAEAGVAVTIVEHFDAALRATPYTAFVEHIRARAGLAGFLMTPDAAFGRDREGTPETLDALGRTDGFVVVVVPPFNVDGPQVRSNAIRSLIATGDLRAATRLLGRRVAVVGERTEPGAEGGMGGTVVRFPMPVALPPPGSYRVLVGPAWSPTAGAPRATRAATAEVDAAGEGIVVRSRAGLPASPRLRVAFVAPTTDRRARRRA
ncbi:MAG: FAD synthetase family protein [Chloroflexi bacterium]|jgi:riboflavin kinase/FMN adenylyltransferase|nr:FAD synthetase family protein [Chloroflexota bacterium]